MAGHCSTVASKFNRIRKGVTKLLVVYIRCQGKNTFHIIAKLRFFFNYLDYICIYISS